MHLVMLIKNAAENANWNERETLADRKLSVFLAAV